MPRTPKPYHHYMVFINSYASAQIKADIEAGRAFLTGPDQLVSTSVYSGSDERQAGIKFSQACKQAMTSPLVRFVIMYRDSDEIARVRPDR
jgi:hypothetical protein